MNCILLITFGPTFVIVILTLFSALILSIILLYRVYKRNNSNKVKLVLIGVTIILVIWVISFAYIQTLVIGGMEYSLKDDNYDYLIILGAGIKGEKLTSVLKGRLDKGIEVFQSDPDINIILSGGQDPGEDISEAGAMENYLIENGIPKEKLILEDRSTSTFENFMYSKELLKTEEALNAKLLVVTSDYHLHRAEELAEDNGLIVDGVASKIPILIRVNGLVREYFAVIKSYFFD